MFLTPNNIFNNRIGGKFGGNCHHRQLTKCSKLVESQLEIVMLIKKLRQDKSFSQEQLAEAAQLSLRTIQRIEAGHRVSYASLRSLAAVFEINVDLLEQELYSMTNSKNEFIEKPLWVRIILNLPSLSRLEGSALNRHEKYLLAYAFFAYTSSFFIPRVNLGFLGLTTTDAIYFSAFSALFLAYISSIMVRIRGQYKTTVEISSR